MNPPTPLAVQLVEHALSCVRAEPQAMSPEAFAQWLRVNARHIQPKHRPPMDASMAFVITMNDGGKVPVMVHRKDGETPEWRLIPASTAPDGTPHAPRDHSNRAWNSITGHVLSREWVSAVLNTMPQLLND